MSDNSMQTPVQDKIDAVADKLAAPQTEQAQSKHSIFEDAYSGIKAAGGNLVKAAEDHPLITGGAALVGSALVFESLGGAFEKACATGAGDVAKDCVASETTAAASAERARILKEVGPIPDVDRPALNGMPMVPEQFTRAANAYKSAINELKNQPTAQILVDAQDLGAVAREALERRTAITGEKVTADSVADETKRLAARNPGLDAEAGKVLPLGTKVELYDHQDLSKLAEKTQFRFVPQLGQFLKENGVTEEQIEKALAVQKAQPEGAKKLLGQILTDEGLATREQVDAAFGKQGEMKKMLAEVRKAQGL